MSDTKFYSSLDEQVLFLERVRHDIAMQYITMVQEGTVYAQDVCFKDYVKVCDLLKELYKKEAKRL